MQYEIGYFAYHAGYGLILHSAIDLLCSCLIDEIIKDK